MAKEFSFHEESEVVRNRNRAKEKGLVGLLIKLGLAKNAAQANVYFMCIIAICLGVIVYFNL